MPLHAIPNPLTQFLWNVFISIAMIITLYTFNFYYLVVISRHQKKNNSVEFKEIPTVTVQLPIYNEKYVAARLVHAVCELDYPKDKLCIQVLDDSNDETYDLLENLVLDYQKKGFDIHHIRRSNREGYKAGALRNAMKLAKGDFITIFDADFIPPTWFLKKTMSYFCTPNIGLVQCRWGHVNEKYSPLTKAQALSLDFHFLIEQKAKSNSHLFMSFNGTAGIWRRQCIEDSGGWHTATLVEDLDLSYRAQMKGWKCVFIPDIVVDAELPVQMNAAKRQQFRWAKGSIQCAIKLLGDVLVKRRIPVDTKIQAFVQLTRHIVHPLVLAQFLILPILLASKINLYIVSGLPALTIIAYLAMGPIAYIMVIRGMYKKNWRSKTLSYLYLIIYSAGMSVNNTVAVFDAFFGRSNEFLRTPKFGIIKNDDDWRDKAYALPFTKTTLLEIFFGVYGVVGIFIAIFSSNPIFAPILGIQAIGFFYIAYLSISHSTFKKGKSRRKIETKAEKMANHYYKAALAGIIALIVVGVVMAFEEYGSTIYPLDQSRGILLRIQATSDPQLINHDLGIVQQLLPKSGNPVWIFPTSDTDFGMMQKDLDTMSSTVDKISTTSADSAAFHTGMLNIHYQSSTLVFNLLDATPYMYVSISNMLFGSIWVAVIIGIFALLKKKKDRLQSLETAE